MSRKKNARPPQRFIVRLADGTTQSVWVSDKDVRWGDNGFYERHPTDHDLEAVMRHVATAMGKTLEGFELAK